MKELIDLGTPGQPSSGDNLTEGGQKINNHINVVYDAFSRKGQDPAEQILQATGVYQSVSYANTDEVEGHFEYGAKVGEMLIVDMEGEVRITLPQSAFVGSQVKIISLYMNGLQTVKVYATGGQTVMNEEFVVLTPGIEYQFMATLDTADGDWSMRNNGNSVSTKEPTITLEIIEGVVIVDCSLANYFVLDLTTHVTNINFINTPDFAESTTKVIRINQEFNASWTVNLVAMGGWWSNSAQQADTLVNEIGLLAVTFIAGTRFNTWVNGWFGPG